jgi:hypothetical protein
MRARGVTITSGVLGLIGLALLVFETVQALRNQVLGTGGTTLLYVGVGLIAIAGVIVALALPTEPSASSASSAGIDTADVEPPAEIRRRR